MRSFGNILRDEKNFSGNTVARFMMDHPDKNKGETLT